MTSGILLCAAALFWGLQVEEVSSASMEAESISRRDVGRPFHELNRDLRETLRREAAATDANQWVATVFQLTDLYGEIMRDRRLATSDTLERYRVKLRSRLLKIQRQLERDLDRLAKSKPASAADDDALQRAGSERLAALLWLGGDSLGGPPTYYKFGRIGGWGAGGAARTDYGSTLVELIRRTISPEFWDVNGGPGTIVYYSPWYALVVRATAEVHERIGGELGGIRD